MQTLKALAVDLGQSMLFIDPNRLGHVGDGLLSTELPFTGQFRRGVLVTVDLHMSDPSL